MLQLRRSWPFPLGMLLVYLAPATLGAVMAATGQSGTTSQALARAAWSYLALLVYPVAAMVIGFFAGWRLGAVWLVPVLVAVLSLPFSIQFLGTSSAALLTAAVYLGIYLAFGLAGWFLDRQVHLRQRAAQQPGDTAQR